MTRKWSCCFYITTLFGFYWLNFLNEQSSQQRHCWFPGSISNFRFFYDKAMLWHELTHIKQKLFLSCVSLEQIFKNYFINGSTSSGFRNWYFSHKISQNYREMLFQAIEDIYLLFPWTESTQTNKQTNYLQNDQIRWSIHRQLIFKTLPGKI